jgi:hypothetical protein
LAVWDRLPRPPFAAAAAMDLKAASETIPIETFGELVMCLATSKYLRPSDYGLRGGAPTLRKLLKDVSYRDRILQGEFAATSPDQWRCALCKSKHGALEDCPPQCRGCGHRHLGPCAKLLALEHRERDEREREEREAQQRDEAQQLAGERGISEDEAAAVLVSEQKAADTVQVKHLMAQIRAGLAASARKQAMQ